MRRPLSLLSVLLLLTLLPACDLLGGEEDDGFTLRYVVSGGFAACQVSYTGVDGAPVLVQAELPFEAAITVDPTDDEPFRAELAASCTTDGSAASVRAQTFVNGLATAGESAQGTSVAVTTAVAIYADGRVFEE